MLINLNTLDQMFEDTADKSCLTYDGCCHSCGRKFKIEIHHHSSGGYGLLGGVLYGRDADQLIARCEACYHKDHKLEGQKQ